MRSCNTERSNRLGPKEWAAYLVAMTAVVGLIKAIL